MIHFIGDKTDGANGFARIETIRRSGHKVDSAVSLAPASKRSRQIQSAAVIAIAALSALLSAGCETTTSTAVLSGQAAPPTRVTLAAGDTIKLAFPATPELNQSQKIRADGKLSLPFIGEVDAAGKTVGQFQSELVQLYKPQLKSSEVVVTLESGVTHVVVSGAVAKPQKILFDKPTTVLQAIMEAGGATEFGSLRNVHLIRITNGVERSQIMDLRPTLSGQTTRAFYVRDGDVVYVPTSPF